MSRAHYLPSTSLLGALIEYLMRASSLPAWLTKVQVERAERRPSSKSRKLQLEPSCIMWERPNEGNLRILKFKNQSRKKSRLRTCQTTSSGRCSSQVRCKSAEVPPCEPAQLLPSLDEGALLGQVSLTKEKHTTARNTQDQILSEACGQREILTRLN